MESFFDIWSPVKKNIHHTNRAPHFKNAEIRWVQMGHNIGSEIYGKGERFQRPVIILKKVFGDSAIVIPLTSKKSEGSYYFSFKDLKTGKIQYALLTQIRYIDGKRILGKISSMSVKDFQALQEKTVVLLT